MNYFQVNVISIKLLINYSDYNKNKEINKKVI